MAAFTHYGKPRSQCLAPRQPIGARVLSRALTGRVATGSYLGPFRSFGVPVTGNTSSVAIPWPPHGRPRALYALGLVIDVGPHTHISRSWPAGQDHAGSPGLLEPRRQMAQSSPLGAGTHPDERSPMV